MEFLLKEKGIKYAREEFLPPSFEGEGNRNKPDFIIEDKIIIDFKAKNFITKEDYYQMRRYLASINLKLGIIYNFRCQVLIPKRVINSEFK
jgi:GxxExxY protein